MPVVLTCSVVFPWVRMPISSIHSLRLQCVGCASYMRSSGAVPVSCFLFLALCTLFRFFLDFSHFSFFRRPSVTVFLSSQVILFCFVLLLFFCYFFVTIILFIDLFYFFSICFPVQQTTNRIGNRVQCFFCFLFVNMVGARSVNVMNTTTTTTQEMYFYEYL